MRASHPGLSITGLLVVLGSAACSGGSRGGVQSAAQPATASTTEIDSIYRARMDSVRMRFTEADVQFMTGMIGHHSQAILMARLAPSHGASPSIQVLAGRVINAQNDEIALMQQWLRDRRQPIPEVHISGTTLTVQGHDHILHMPGMLTVEQLRELDQARGPEFDRLFLTYMIQHHRGAITMVEGLFNTAGAGQEDVIFKLASDINVDQITEINRMELMLAALPKGDAW